MTSRPASPAARLISALERHQVALYLGALAVGALAGLTLPAANVPIAAGAAALINPALGLLLYATFLSIPLAHLGAAMRDWRFLAAVLAVNFVLVPPVAYLLTRPLEPQPGLLFGALLVLLAPCVDYVIAFTGLAGGAKDRLLAAAPLLLLAQFAALPPLLWLFAGHDAVAHLDPAPFWHALLTLIVLPLIAAAATQVLAERGGPFALPATRLTSVTLGAMVPLMMLVLAAVVASQIAGVASELDALAGLLPIYAGFAVVMVALGPAVGRVLHRAPGFHAAGFDLPARRALVFTGVTRNSLVVLPIALAAPYALAPLAVVTQTLVELVVMVLLVRFLPALTRT